MMRDLMKALSELEKQLEETYGVSLYEAMVLCSIGTDTVTAGHIITCTGLNPSHASKIIRIAEEKKLLIRELGKVDKRQMFFTLTPKGKDCLENIRKRGINIPELLAPLIHNK